VAARGCATRREARRRCADDRAARSFPRLQLGRARYVCGGTIAHGPGYCSQPSIRRALIDGPFLSTLLDSYIDLDATRQRIADRASEALILAREAAEQAEVELHKAEQRIIRVRRGWQDAVIDDAGFRSQTAELASERDAALEALQQALARVAGIEKAGVAGDAEQALLDRLATLKQAVGEGVGAAPDTAALRNIIGDLFERVELIRSGSFGVDFDGGGLIAQPHDVPTPDAEDRYWLMLVLRDSVVKPDALEPAQAVLSADDGTPNPTGQDTPVEWFGQ
jgi:hypothetical protein